MSNSKTTLKALIISTLMLFMCVTMLLSTTYAWFTEKLEIKTNTLVAGNLDVGFDYYTGTGYAPITADTDLFNITWEPGESKTVYLRLSNEGTVDLNYKFAVRIIDEKPGVNLDGGKFNLSDYINVNYFPYHPRDLEAGHEVSGDEADTTKLFRGYLRSGVLAHSEGDCVYIGIKVELPATAAQSVNYKYDAPYIKLGLDLLTTQAGESAAFSDGEQLDDYSAVLNTSNTLGIGAGSKVYGKADTAYVIDSGIYESLSEFGFDRITEAGTVIKGEDVTFEDYVEIYVCEGATLALEGLTFKGGLSINTYDDTKFDGNYDENSVILIKDCEFKESSLDLSSLAPYRFIVDSCIFKGKFKSDKNPEYAIGVNRYLGDAAKTAGVEIRGCSFKYIGENCIELPDICYDALIEENKFDDWATNTGTGAAVRGGFAGTIGSLTVSDNSFYIRETDTVKYVRVLGSTSSNTFIL